MTLCCSSPLLFSYIYTYTYIHIFLDALAKSLSDLMALVKLLREDIAYQRQEIAYLRMLLENCAGCKEPKGDNDIRIETTCRTSNPCYPGKSNSKFSKDLHSV